MPFTVRRLILREIVMPLVEPFAISSGSVAARRILLVEAIDADGAAGWGECVAGEEPYYSPETIDTARLAIERWLGPRVIGRRLEHPREVAALLGPGVQGHCMAKAAIEMALWALAAEIEKTPLAKLLGGTRENIEVGISIGIQESDEALVERAQRAAAEGYRRVKLKIKPGADVLRVAAVRAALGPGTRLSVDANAAYTLRDADQLAKLDAFGLLMIEQPLRAGDLLRHATLARLLRTPICLDESITSADDARDALDLGSARIVNIKPGRVGGLASALAVHEICRLHGVPNWCGGMLESGIGRAANVALASLPNFTLPGDVSPSARYWQRDIVSPEWTMDAAGFMRVPLDRPGLGVEVDRERIEGLTEARWAIK